MLCRICFTLFHTEVCGTEHFQDFQQMQNFKFRTNFEGSENNDKGIRSNNEVKSSLQNNSEAITNHIIIVVLYKKCYFIVQITNV